YAMWLEVSKKADCYLINETLAMYRKRVGSISNHSYLKLIKWHYKLFKEAERKNSAMSFILTLNNLIYGLIKKLKYKKKLK
ncbi:MAG: UDP-galactose phosphate transferase, partial [Clostridium paraputrificum]